MRIKLSEILDQAIEVGVTAGWNRAHKHTENPPREFIEGQIRDAIWSRLYEFLDFSDESEQARQQ